MDREQELREKVVKGLSSIHAVAVGDGAFYVTECGMADFNRLLTDAAQLLKRLEPVAPVRKDGLYRCGNCLGTVVGYIADFSRRLIKTDNYCRKCGREVKW